MFTYNVNAECGDCQNCMMRRVNLPDTCFVINGEPLGFVYNVYCKITDDTVPIHCKRAELCRNFIRKEPVKVHSYDR